MKEPKIVAKSSTQMELKAGERYCFCSCGLSENQPFCDGSHKGTDFRPDIYVPEEDELKWICNCNQSSIMPFCDGTHKKL